MLSLKLENVNKNDILVKDIVSQFSLAQTLLCGQAFRWVQLSETSFCGVAMGKFLNIQECGNDILFKDTTMDDFNNVWVDYFDLNTDYEQLKDMFCQDTVLADAITYAPGIRVLKQDPWETVCSFIISANNNIPRITKIIEQLCVIAGEKVCDDYYSFPTPESMFKLTEDDFGQLKCGYRTKYLKSTTTKIMEKQVALEEVASLDYLSAKKMLMLLDGVGPKVADCVLLFGYGFKNAVPTDTWIKKVMAVLYPQGLPEEILPYGGIAQQYLFHYARHHGHLFE